MNFHSYDVLLVTPLLIALLACQVLQKRVSWAWVGRVAAMGAGAVPPALWFWHVLRNDPVFQARAATETFSPNFRQMAAGLIFLVVLTAVSVFAPTATYRDMRRRVAMACGLAAGFILWAAAGRHQEGYWISSFGAWLILFIVAVAVAVGLSTPNPAKNLFLAWASVSLVGVYFPALFQRKLAMGIQIPWAVLGALGLALVIQRVDRNMRNLATVLGLVLVGATSGLWLQRELLYLRWNVSNTTVHAPYISSDAARIVDYLSSQAGRKVVLAMPGIPAPLEAPDRFGTPIVPDLNPILTGLAGCVTYAGHWSETPNYVERRRRLTSLFLATSPESTVDGLLAETNAHYIVAPVPEAFRVLPVPLRDLTARGEVVVNGTQFRLIRLTAPAQPRG
jgi:arabinosyltransferase C